MKCNSELARCDKFGAKIDLNAVLDAKPVDYKVKLKYTSIGAGKAGIYLSSAKIEDTINFYKSPLYHLGITDFVQRKTTLDSKTI